MNTISQISFLFSLFLLLTTSIFAQSGKYISLKQRTEILENRNKLTTNIDLYFDNDKYTITKVYHSKPEYLIISNALGETKTYYPKQNEVSFNQIAELSSKKNFIYYFANNFTDHLGLADEGFNLISNTFEDPYYITNWQAPSSLKRIKNVKMVFENGLPIYSEYQSNKEKTLRKIYYLNYQDYRQFRLPSKIVEINYLPKGDSIISRTIFSDVTISARPDNDYFNFKIPGDAKPLNSTEDN